MEWVETTGRTTEEAKDHALDQLGVDESDAEFEIVEEPRPGLFGRIRGEARVRARVRPTAPRPKTERRDRRRRRTTVRSRHRRDSDRRSATTARLSPPRPRPQTSTAPQSEEDTMMEDGQMATEDGGAGATNS